MIWIVLLFQTFAVVSSTAKYDIWVNVSEIVRKVPPFWHSTGFCPPLPHEKANGYDLSEDEKQNIIYIGSIPNNGIEQVRIHWLLDLVTLENSTGELVYNFTYLDLLLDRLHDNGLKPGFELMGNPSGYFTTFDDDSQVKKWKELVTSLAKRYISRYGLDYVEQWNFETWNEPDHHDFDTLNITLDGFMRYYDACSEGLIAASPKLRLGGPAGGCHDDLKRYPICWGLLDHCDNGVNFFTGDRGVRIDFISFHHKGGGSSLSILEQELETIRKIREKHPRLASVPVYNDEADPLVGWSAGESWRGDVRYAAIVVKIIAQHLRLLLVSSNSSYSLLSNDNGFMNFGPPHFFDQRTLNTRFPMNKTVPKSVETIRKPVAAVMGLLSLAGELQLKSSVTIGNESVGNDSDVGVVASMHVPTDDGDQHDSVQVVIIVYNSNDTSSLVSNASVQLNIVNIVPHNVSVEKMVYIHYRLDNEHTNPAAVWSQAGKPVFPSPFVFDEMRAQQDPITLSGPSPVTSASFWAAQLNVPLPGVDVIHFCSKPMMAPPQVSHEHIHLHQVHENEVLISWRDVTSRCLLTYNVYFSFESNQSYKHAPTQNSIFTVLSHRVPGLKLLNQNEDVTVYYKVSATDYWQREGEASLPVKITL